MALGVVERRDVPPSALFRLVPEHVAARAVLQLVDAHDLALQELARSASELNPAPTSVVIFGSFARAEAVTASDLDVLVVRPDAVDEDDADWRREIDEWAQRARRVTGNRVELLEVSESEAGRRRRSRQPLWLDGQRDGSGVRPQPLSAEEAAQCLGAGQARTEPWSRRSSAGCFPSRAERSTSRTRLPGETQAVQSSVPAVAWKSLGACRSSSRRAPHPDAAGPADPRLRSAGTVAGWAGRRPRVRGASPSDC